jgi:hypothetical protein
MSTEQIPEELKKLQQWVCFDVSEDGRKLPFIPGTTKLASSDRPHEWRSFRMALKDVTEGKRQHLGFAFSSDDPYVFLDLDDPSDKDQQRIWKRLNTYSQRSVSGDGCHLICRGNFKGSGRHPAKKSMGLFKERRFCLMTGDVVGGRSTINVVADEDLEAIARWLGGGTKTGEELIEHESEIPDLTVYQMGVDRFQKYKALANGDWQQFEEYGGDHSTADHAFLAMLCDLTDSNDQVRKLFYYSGMWNDSRAAKKAAHGLHGYVNRTIKKVRSEQARVQAIEDKITLALFEEEEIPEQPVETTMPVVIEKTGSTDLIESLPDGLIKQAARYVHKSSILPLQESSLLAALTLFSGMCGRAWLTPTMSGLNLWLVLVADTGSGKDQFNKGLGRILGALAKRQPSALNILGGEFVSGPAVEQALQDTKRYISYVPEFGHFFQRVSNPNAPDHMKTLQQQLLDAFNAADRSGQLRCRKRAQRAEGPPIIERPCVCLVGETTPTSMFDSLSIRDISTGFLPRLTILESAPDSWSDEENPQHGALPSKKFMDKLEELFIVTNAADLKNSYTVVEQTEAAEKLLKAYRYNKRKITRNCDSPVEKDVINRAGLKVLRLASLLAIAEDFYNPTISVEHAKWSINFIDRTDEAVLQRFTSGNVGQGQVKQETEILRVVRKLAQTSVKERIRMKMVPKVAKDRTVIPYGTLKNRCVGLSCFASDRAGAVSAFDKAVKNLNESGVLITLPQQMAADRYDTVRGKLLFYDKDADTTD